MRNDHSPPWSHLLCGQKGLQAEKAHAAQLDAALGLRCEEIEAQLITEARKRTSSEQFQDWGRALHHRDHQTWVGLPVQSLMTPYAELLRVLETLAPAPGDLLTDLGAGYGRLGYITALRFPAVSCLSYEYVPERVLEGNRIFKALVGARFSLVQADVSASNFNLPRAHFHFLYDLGSAQAIQSVIQKIQTQAQEQKVTVIGRGKATRHFIENEHPWLSQITPPAHHDTFSIYRSGD
jgi:hypothetical protein